MPVQAPARGTLSIATPVLPGVCRAVLIAAALEAFREAVVSPVDGAEETGRIVVAWIPERAS